MLSPTSSTQIVRSSIHARSLSNFSNAGLARRGWLALLVEVKGDGHVGLVLYLYQYLLPTSQHRQRCSMRQWSGCVLPSQVDVEQGACVGPLYDLAARSSQCRHEVPSLVWFHLAARSLDDQLANEEVGLLMHHFLLAHLLCAFVGSVISFADVVGDLQASPRTRLLAPNPCFPQGEGKGFAKQVPP